MAADTTKIHIGQGTVFIGGTAPTAGTDPTDPTAGTPSALAAATTAFAGVSGGGVDVGTTFGPATLTYRPTFYMVITEQSFSEVVTVPTSEETSLAFTALEVTYQNIQTAFGQTVTRVVVGPPAANVNYVGGLSSVPTKVVTLVSRKRSGTGYFLLCIYAGYSAEGAAIPFERRAESRLPVTIRAQGVLARPVGDQLFQLIDYAANPA